MKFLEKIGIGKKKEEVVQQPDQPPVQPAQPKLSRLKNVLSVLNQPMGGGLSFDPNPSRTPVERQLGIPEFVAPRDRASKFTTDHKPIPKTREPIKKWRPRPGVPFKNGQPW